MVVKDRYKGREDLSKRDMEVIDPKADGEGSDKMKGENRKELE